MCLGKVVAILAYWHLAVILPVLAYPHVAKVSDVLAVKGVSVSEVPVNVEGMSARMNFVPILQHAKLGTDFEAVAWSDHSYMSLIERRLLCERSGKRECLSIQANPAPDVASGSVPEILCLDVNVCRVSPGFWGKNNFDTRYHHVSAFNSFGRFLLARNINDLSDKNAELQTTYTDQQPCIGCQFPGKINQVVVGFLLQLFGSVSRASLFLLFLGVSFAFGGWKYLDHDRLGLASALFGLGGLCTLLALLIVPLSHYL